MLVSRFLRCIPFLSAAFFAPCLAAGQPRPPADPLRQGFLNPSATAKPQVWWHWMNGNISKDGIRRDLDWMHRVGIGGVDCIDASIDTPQVVDKRLIYMTPEWKDAFLYAVKTADSHSMAFSINSSPGWSETGGPWVTPEQAMKKSVWSKTIITGGKPFHGVLPRPPGNAGPYQNARLPDAGAAVAALDFYRDVRVLAWPQTVAEARVQSASSNGGAVDRVLLTDGDIAKAITLTPPANGADVFVAVTFDKPQTIQGVSVGVSTPSGIGFTMAVEASEDGTHWRPVADMPQSAQLQRLMSVQQTAGFAPVTARFMRMVFRPAPPLGNSYRPYAPAPGYAAKPAATPACRYDLTELDFHTAATVQIAEQKAQLAPPPLDFYAFPSPSAFAPGSAIDPASVIDLTGKMKTDGTLDWTPPPGNWVVMRLGYSLTGKENHPATAEATGLEVDKLNAAHVRSYMTTYLDSYKAVTGPALMGKRGITALTIDSSEVGMQNWTENILSEFRHRNGYDALPWLPALTGVAVKSPSDSDKFLWDFRRTIAALYAENHYGEIAAIAHRYGLTNYAEANETHRPGFGDDIEMRQYAGVPMGAMWSYGEGYPKVLSYEADLLGAASAAHVYGRKLVAAESLTSQFRPWAEGPRDLKPIIDMEFVRGVNQIVLHTSVHQPVDKPPGLSLDSYGQYFNRLESWSGLAKPWVSYIARASQLLQQGHFAADIAYFYGEEAPIDAIWAERRVGDVPKGYAFDFVNLDALLHQMSVDRGELVTQSGMRYRVLYLGGSTRLMTLAALNRITEMVRDGAVLVGKAPEASPSLNDDPACFSAAVAALFGDGAPHPVGKGEVFPSGALTEAFAAKNIAPDFAYRGTDTNILYIHRHLPDGELYFLSNRADRQIDISASFRVSGKTPEIWDAVTGTTRDTGYRIADGRTDMRLSLPSYGSTFVVFRKPAKTPMRPAAPAADKVVAAASGQWTVRFEPDRGAPPQITLNALTSWSDNADPGVKYFSGTATYTTHFITPGKRRGARYVLDLGAVREIAEVRLNGKPVGAAWTPPYRLDVTKALRPGRNVLQVNVANLWVNRLIGDAQPDAAKTYTFTITPTYRADAPLRPSGLLGPVTIQRAP